MSSMRFGRFHGLDGGRGGRVHVGITWAGCRKRLTAFMAGTVLLATGPAGAVCTPGDAINLDPIPEHIRRERTPRFRLTRVAAGLVAPNWGTSAPGDATHLYVGDTAGKLWAVDLASRIKHVVLDVTDLLIPERPLGERGLLGFAFHPGFERNGLLYTYTSEPYEPAVTADFPVAGLAPGTLPNHRSVITEWRVADPKAPRPVVDRASRRIVLRIDQPQRNHNGGALHFGPDRLLYIALGDGGGGEDEGPGHEPTVGNGQATATVLGKILRINPRGTDAPGGQYGIPRTNPYVPEVGGGGLPGCADGACDEIWASGFRNPFRISFDRLTGRLIAADVGQRKIEEIDVVSKGGNYGWRFKEGTLFFQNNGSQTGFVSDVNCLGVPADGLLDPVAQYDHDEGVAVIGGFVYRGAAVAALQGLYLFGDFVSPAVGAGRLLIMNGERLGRPQARLRLIREARIEGRRNLGLFLLGFGQDAAGELYVMGNQTGASSLPTGAAPSGVVLKIVPTLAAQSAIAE